MASGPGTKVYGSLSVWCQIHGRITEKVSVSPEAFFPRPKVRSTILKFELYDQPLVKVEETAALRGLVRAAFGQRRKTLGNALSAWLKGGRGEIERLLHARRYRSSTARRNAEDRRIHQARPRRPKRVFADNRQLITDC